MFGAAEPVLMSLYLAIGQDLGHVGIGCLGIGLKDVAALFGFMVIGDRFP